MKKTIALSCLLFCFNYLVGQLIIPTQKQNKFGVALSYFAKDAGYMGTTVGIETMIQDYVMMGFQVGAFWKDEYSKPDISTLWEIGTRETFPSGYSPEFRAGIGYLSTNKANKNELAPPKLESYLMPSVTVGLLGYDFQQQKDIPLRIFANILFYWKLPAYGKGSFNKGFLIGGTYFLN